MGSNEDFSILVVSEKISDLNVMARILEPAYRVRTGTCGKDETLSGGERPDIILLDADMADADSFETLFFLKEHDDTRDIPVIMITDRTNHESEARWLFLGAVDHIAKPFVSSIVMSKIKNQIQTIRHMRTIKFAGGIDPLTELPDRAAFERQLDVEWKRGVVEQTDLSLVVMDIDMFRNFNELYGYPQGNTALQLTAETIGRTLKRKSDFIARLGNDEFGIILPNTDYEGAMLVAESIRQNIESMEIPTVDHTAKTRITVSIGAAAASPTFERSASELWNAANYACEEAKKTPGAD